MTEKNLHHVILNSENGLLELNPGDRVKVYLESKTSKYMVYGLNPFKEITEGSYLRLIEVPENFSNVTQFDIWESYVKFLQFDNGIKFNHLYTQHKIITKDSHEFEKAKGLVELLNRPQF